LVLVVQAQELEAFQSAVLGLIAFSQLLLHLVVAAVAQES
jgi:hypothetical protein